MNRDTGPALNTNMLDTPNYYKREWEVTQNQARGSQSPASGLVTQQRQSLNFRGAGFVQQTSMYNKPGTEQNRRGTLVYTTTPARLWIMNTAGTELIPLGRVLFSKRSCRSLWESGRWEGPIAEIHLFLPYNDQTELWISVYTRGNSNICWHMSVHRGKWKVTFIPQQGEEHSWCGWSHVLLR